MYNFVTRKFNLARKFLKESAARLNSAPLIILGKEKSGTTAIAALLAKYTGLSVTLDIPNIWGPMETKIYNGETTFAEFVKNNKYHFSKDIIKEPCLTFLYPKVKKVFPKARFVMIIRDPRDNIRSVLNRLGISGNLGDIDLNTLSSVPRGWEVVLDSRWLGLQGNNYIEIAAARWNLAADVFIKNRDEMLLLRYEDFFIDKVGTINKLAQALGFAKTIDISTYVDIQYQSKGDQNITWKDFFGLKNLNRIEQICKDRMKEFGYNV